MRTFELLSTFTRSIVHRVVVRHAISGQPIPSLGAELADAPPDWSIAVINGDVVVAAPQSPELQPAPPAPVPPAPISPSPLSPTPSVRLAIADPAVELYLDTSGNALTVNLTDAELAHTFAPTEQQVQVRLLAEDGTPSEGQTVTIHATSSGASHPTTEIAPGIYQTEPVVFTPSFRRFAVRLNGAAIGPSTQLDNYRTTTAVTVIEP